MKLPKTSENIFPESTENYTALLEHYFPMTTEEERSLSLKNWLDEKKSFKFSLSQIEFGARLCRENEVLLDLRGFSSIPSARIHFTLMALFIPIEEWNSTYSVPSNSLQKRMKEFRTMYTHQPELFNKIDSSGFINSFFPKSTENLEAIYKIYFLNEGEVERLRFLKHFLNSRDSLGAIHFAAQFCKVNHDFLKEAGVSRRPKEMVHEVLTAIFYPSYNWLLDDFNADGNRYKEIKNKYLKYIKII